MELTGFGADRSHMQHDTALAAVCKALETFSQKTQSSNQEVN